MPKVLRAGIVGSGFMAKVHARAIRDAGHEVIGIASSTPESARRVADQIAIGTVFDSWQELVDSDSVDVVHVCTPNELHAEIAIAAANAGKNIVCEKPIAVSYAEAKEIRDAVEGNGVEFAVPFAYRFYPVVREMRQRLQHGEAGPVHLIHGNYLQDWLADEEATNWRVDSTHGGVSRAFADIGTHWCDLMEFVSGDRIASLTANCSRAYENRGGRKVLTEDIANVIFKTVSGVSGSLTVSQVSLGRKNQLLIEFDGSKASYTFNQENPDSLLVGGKTSNQIITHGQETLRFDDAKRLSQVPSGHPQGYQDAFNAFMADAYDVFQGEKRDGVANIEDGVRAAALVEAVVTSAESKQWVEVVISSGLKDLEAELLVSK
ncbi:MAG: Gfo/Idh/MocA family protein [Micrococcales bacterium]